MVEIHLSPTLSQSVGEGSSQDNFESNIKLLFQPAEEIIAGAPAMIKEGVLENLPVNACFSCRVCPSIPVGKIGVIHGPSFAAINNFIIHISGKGGYSAMPHKTIDPITIQFII